MAIKNTVSIDFYLRSLIVLAFLIATYQMCLIVLTEVLSHDLYVRFTAINPCPAELG